MSELSDLDYKLILELQKDGRKSFAELSKKLGTSISTIRRRVNSLVEEGTISISAVPDPLKFYGTVTLIGFSVELKKIKKIVNELCKDHCNQLVALTTGRYDIVSYSMFKDNRELSDYLVRRISQIDGIRTTETLLVLTLQKRTYGWIREKP